jgi:hypothetical protein
MLFGIGLATKIYLAVEAVDMRKGFEGLFGAVRETFGEGTFPMAGSGRQAQRHHAIGRVGNAGEWSGCEAHPAAKVVSQERVKSPRILLETPLK